MKSRNITININDTSPLVNTAYVDTGKENKVYNKAQVLELMEEIKEGTLGSILPSQTLVQLNALADGNYYAAEAGTYAFGEIVPEGWQYRFNKTGTVWKVLTKVEMKMQDLTEIETELENTKTKVDDFIENYKPLVSEIFDESDNEVAAGMKATAEWLGIGTVTKQLGISVAGDSTDTSLSNGGTGNLLSNTYCKTTTDIVINSIATNFTTGGDFKLAITDNNNVVIWTSSEIYNAGAGWQTTLITSKELKKDQTLWISLINGSAITIKFGMNGGGSNNFIQRNISNGNITNGPTASFYSMYFNYEIAIGDQGILSKYLSKQEANGYTDIGDKEVFGSSVADTPIGNQVMIAYYILKTNFSESKTITTLNIASAASGNMLFVIGALDQANKFIERKTFELSVINGLNKINISEELQVGEFIGVKTPGLMPNVNTSKQHSLSWGVEGSYTNPLTQINSWSLAMSIEVVTRIYNDNAFAKKSDIKELKNQIENIEVPNVFKSPDGTSWKIIINNEGKITTQAVGKFTKMLHFGNSILKHDIVDYWWGNWGMAASGREKDYAHRFLSKIKVLNPTAQSWEYNIANWELNPIGYNKTQLDPFLNAQQYDLIVIRLGENATATPATTYKTAFRDLINYIQNKVPTARIIIGGMFWQNTQLDNAMREVAIEKGLTFSDMSGLETADNKSFIGDVVKGDDGQNHTVNNQGVANHPNDKGMEAIAERLFNASNS